MFFPLVTSKQSEDKFEVEIVRLDTLDVFNEPGRLGRNFIRI